MHVFPLLLVDPLSTGERGMLLWPGFGFEANLLIACNTSFFPLARSCNEITKLWNSIPSSSSHVPFPLSKCIPIGSMSELVSSNWISSNSYSSVYLLFLLLWVTKVSSSVFIYFSCSSPQLARNMLWYHCNIQTDILWFFTTKLLFIHLMMCKRLSKKCMRHCCAQMS